ncbi:hypothetical protein AGMMS50255_2130 [Spirochaetia bacterium]|nr:hypothetical protein AGMMS50255_2130 [Spirochaetia bacterium]
MGKYTIFAALLIIILSSTMLFAKGKDTDPYLSDADIADIEGELLKGVPNHSQVPVPVSPPQVPVPELTSSPQSLEGVPAEDTVAESSAIQTAIKKTPVFVQPFTRTLWDEAQAGAWDIRHMQLYVSGTVVLEYEKYSTDLTARTNSQSVEETLRGINYTGTVSTNEMITNSAYENALIVLETMTPGVALKFIPGKWQNILEVSFEGDTADQQKFLRFVQNYNDSDGYFYLEPLNKTKITYGDKKYEIRFNERGGSPYLMIRTEYTASTRSNILPGRRIP